MDKIAIAKQLSLELRCLHPRLREDYARLEIDEDGSGELEFGEFCALLAKVKRGDVGNLHGFAKLTEDIKATPVLTRSRK